MSDEFASDEVPEDDSQIAAWVKSKAGESRAKGFRASFEAQWMRNIAYRLGYSGVVFDASLRQFRNSDGKSYGGRRNRVHINKILPTLQNRLARLVKQRPKYLVRPNSNRSEDKDSARLSEQVLSMVWDRERISYKYIELIDWAQVMGHCYFKVCWDPNQGEQMVDPMTGDFGYEGGIRIDVVPGFEVFPDPIAKDMDELQWLIHSKVRKLDYFKSQYGSMGEQVKPEDTFMLSLQYESRINNMNANSNGFAGGNPQTKDKNTAIEMAYYQKRTKNYPNGRLIIVANGILLENKELPIGEIPFVKFDDVLAPGKFYSEAITTHLVPIQDQYNNVISRRARWTNLMLAGKYIIPRGSGLTQESLNDREEVLEYDPVVNAPPPMAMNIPNIPSYAYNEEAALDRMFNEVAGINEVSKGQTLSAPNAPSSAIGLQFMQQQDETRIGVQCTRNELGLATFFSMVLKYAGKYIQIPTLLKISGSNNSYQVKEFVGKDLDGNFDVTVLPGSTVPVSPYAKKEEVLTYYKAGLLGDPANPETREKVIKMLEFGDLADVWQDYGLDMNQIKHTIMELKKGIPQPVSQFDNHTLFLQELNRFRKSDDFRQIAPETQQLFLKTMDEHINVMIDTQMPPPPGVNAPPIEMPSLTDMNNGGPMPPGEAPPQGPEPQPQGV